MRLKDLVQIDNRFEKSVNLLLDLNDKKKVNAYILTRSSINLLKHSSGQRKQQIKEILMDFTIWVSAMNRGGA